ncbi:MAG: serine hydrolase [Bacteroidetes bacterium]|nr:serine hydrolase [Bacteroidota bacterium]
MKTNRRQFIKTAGIGVVGLGIMGEGIDLWGGERFRRATPESQGVASRSIREFVAAANASGISWHSFMLLRHGQVVAEGWWKPYEPEFVHSLYSLSKSFTSTAIGLLVKEGKLDIHSKVVSFFPDDLPAAVSDNLGQVTVRSLLTMNTGHAEDTMPKMRASSDTWVRAYLAQPVGYAPGTHFLYNTGNTYMLGAILHKVTGQTLEDYLRPRLFQPLGFTGYDWEVSPQGLNTAGYGLRLKTEDIAKLGQLYLQKGRWKGNTILTGSWVDEATSKQTESQVNNGDWSQGYGYQWWRCTHGFYRGDGAYGQYCIVMPQYDAVMVVTSQTPDMQKSMNIIWDHIPGGMREGELPENGVEHAALKRELSMLELPVVKGGGSKGGGSKGEGSKGGGVKEEGAKEEGAKGGGKAISTGGGAVVSTSGGNAISTGGAWVIAANEFGINQLEFDLSDKGCVLNVLKGGRRTKLQFGWEKWVLNGPREAYVFGTADLVPMPSRVAGTATWIDEHTLRLNLRFVEAIFGDAITCRFEENGLKVEFLNSVSEMALKKSDDPRKVLEGRRG